jgi:hypothetical protein
MILKHSKWNLDVTRDVLVLHLAEILELQHFDVTGLVQFNDALLAVDGQQAAG